jgi:hypothetical protein
VARLRITLDAVTEQPHPIPTAILNQTGRVALDLACSKCGCNLRTMLPADACPECGLSVAHSLAETLDAEARVQVDFACLKCAYNLRSLKIDGNCPECGLPVTDSIRGDLLQFADPSWVKGLATGATLLLAAGISAVTAILSILGGMSFDPYDEGIRAAVGAMALMIGTVGAIATPLLTVFGLAKLTRPEPRVSLRPEKFSPRRACRYSFVAAIVLLGICLATLLVMPSGPVGPAWVGVALVTTTFVVVLAALPATLLRHLV